MDAVTWAAADAVDRQYAWLLQRLYAERMKWGPTDRIVWEIDRVERARESERKEALRA